MRYAYTGDMHRDDASGNGVLGRPRERQAEGRRRALIACSKERTCRRPSFEWNPCGPALPRSPTRSAREECRARAQLFRLLAGAFAEEPGRDYLQALRQPGSLASLAEAGLSFDADFLTPPLEQLVDELACEFATLLAAPGGCPPVESARLTGRYQQQPYFEVKQAYREAGFEVQRGRFEVFDDALGVELLFVAALLDRAATAQEQGDRSGAGARRKVAQALLGPAPGPLGARLRHAGDACLGAFVLPRDGQAAA